MSIDSTQNQWTPPPGRHQVSMGGSMTRFLKQRKGVQQTKQNKAMPTSNFYHFKYNFMPESVDTSKPGVVELTTKDITTARVERANQQSDEVYIFRGKEEPAKEIECVLIFDPESGLYTLEKLDSSLILHHEGRGPPKARQPSASPMPNTPSPAASTSKIDDDASAELSREIEDALKEEDDDNDEEIPLSASSRKLASSAKKAETIRAPVPASVSNGSGKPRPKLRGSTATGSSSVAKSKPSKPSPLATTLPPPPVQASILANRSLPNLDQGKAPLTHAQTIDVEEEVLEFGKPARQAQRTRISPQPAPPVIALPGTAASNGLALPSSGGHVTLPGSSAGVGANQDDEDEDDYWIKVAGAGVSSSGAAPMSANGDDGSIFGDGFADAEEGEEINLDQFAAEVDQELGGMAEGDDEDEELFGAMEEEPSRQPIGRPMSLNQFAGGGDVAVDDPDDDYSSSSEESDDD